ncbi:response regulator transcription factor [Aliivibrio kagoshimensis]|uniref:response regulator transcription factor n=1 Tax=Aliivibrio kagoshimensis TaxID=2910230 RepID=UPI003D146A2F
MDNLNTKDQHVLVVEDDKRLNQMMCEMLRSESYRVSSELDGLSAIKAITEREPDILLLDMGLPGCNGLEVLHRIEKPFSGVIIMITAESDELLEVSALNLGVHDFLTKPLRPHILLAKLRSLSRLKQQSSPQQNHLLCVQDLRININDRALFIGEHTVNVTTAEYEIIHFLMSHPGEVLSREMIINEIRNIDYDGLDRSIDMRISSLRKKLNDNTPPYKYIKTIRAKGYLLPG